MNSMETMNRIDNKKLAELILFFADRCKDDPFFGSTKLNKLLFIADFKSYGHLGKSITGVDYIHQRQGPTPEPKAFLSARNQLVQEGRLVIEEQDTYAGTRKKPVALKKPNMALFTDSEIQICEHAIESLKHLNSEESSDWSHDFPGWLATRDGEIIPYQTVYFWRKEPLTLEDIEWGKSVAKKFGLV